MLESCVSYLFKSSASWLFLRGLTLLQMRPFAIELWLTFAESWCSTGIPHPYERWVDYRDLLYSIAPKVNSTLYT